MKNVKKILLFVAIVVMAVVCFAVSVSALDGTVNRNGRDVQLLRNYMKDNVTISDISEFPEKTNEGVFSVLIDDFDNDNVVEMITFGFKSYPSVTMNLYAIVNNKVVLTDSYDPALILTGQNALINICAFLDGTTIRFQSNALLYGGSANHTSFSSYRISDDNFVATREFQTGGRGTVSKPFYYEENITGKSYSSLQEYNNAAKAAGFDCDAHIHMKEKNSEFNIKSDYKTAQCFKGNHIFSIVKVSSFYLESPVSGDVVNYGFVYDNTNLFGKPENLISVSNISSLNLTWSPVIVADGYRIFYKSGNIWKKYKDVTTETIAISNLTPGTKYSFAVMAGKIVDGKVIWSDTYTTINTATKAIAPAKITAAQNTTAIRLTWTKCPGATGYQIFYKTSTGWNLCVKSTTATSHTFTGLKAGSKFTFAVRPYILTDSEVVWSDYTTYTASTLPAAPKTAVTSPASGKITVKWNAVFGADGYQVYYKTGNGSYKLYKTYTAVQNLNFSGLKSGTKYTFAVRAGIRTSGGNIFGGYKEVSVTVK